jgi:hypothetical protein
MGDWRYSSTILDLGTTCSFIPRPLYTVPLGWASLSLWTLWSRDNPFPLPGLEPRPTVRTLSLYGLTYPSSVAGLINRVLTEHRLYGGRRELIKYSEAPGEIGRRWPECRPETGSSV